MVQRTIAASVVVDGKTLTASAGYEVVAQSPTTVALPLIGMSAPKSLWAQRYAELGTAAPLLQARRIFMTDPTDADLQPLTREADNAGLVPHISFKVGDDWAGTANGRYDTALRAAKSFLDGRRKKAVITFHHEPDEQSTPRDIGEGGSASDFADMYRHLAPLMRSEWIEVWPCTNGWWFSKQARGFTDADIDKWLPRDVRQLVDGIAADHYTASATETETAVMRVTRMVDWAKRCGDVKSLGVWETNAFTAKDLVDVFNLAKSEPLFRGGACMVWNSTHTTYKPLVETGLLDDFQAILRDWPR